MDHDWILVGQLIHVTASRVRLVLNQTLAGWEY